MAEFEPYQQDASQEERRRTLRNDQRQASTLLDQAKLSEQLDAGRYKSAISGTEPTVDYPRLPFSPWTNDPPEAPLVQPCGTEAEIERSLASFGVCSIGPLSSRC
jgi:hypothetical protein